MQGKTFDVLCHLSDRVIGNNIFRCYAIESPDIVQDSTTAQHFSSLNRRRDSLIEHGKEMCYNFVTR